jgi:hypothetical protein
MLTGIGSLIGERELGLSIVFVVDFVAKGIFSLLIASGTVLAFWL